MNVSESDFILGFKLRAKFIEFPKRRSTKCIQFYNHIHISARYQNGWKFSFSLNRFKIVFMVGGIQYFCGCRWSKCAVLFSTFHFRIPGRTEKLLRYTFCVYFVGLFMRKDLFVWVRAWIEWKKINCQIVLGN